VPQSLVRSWHRRRDDWLARHGIDPQATDWRLRLRESPELEREYHTMFTRPFRDYLDRGHGACVLRNEVNATVVADSLRHFDGDRYHLGDFIAMPNHVHLLVCLLGTTQIEAQCTSWKKCTASEINRRLGRSGRLWQEESFDHLVRSPEQFEHFQRYIASNPERARLPAGEYLHWTRPM
jgi:type I restriction enzyme R subunit